MKNTFTLASTGKRFLALFIDAFLAFILTSLLYTYVTGVYMFKAIGGAEKRNTFFSYVDRSGLFNNTPDENGDYNYSSLYLLSFDATKDENGKYGYECYLDTLWNYYTDFMPNEAVDKLEGCATVNDSYTYFYEKVLGMTTPDFTKEYGADEAVEKFGNDYFTYTLGDDSRIDITKKPTAVSTVTDENAEEYMSYFYSSNSGIYYDAAYALSQTDHFVELGSSYRMESWICYITAFIPLQLIFFYVIPVVMKNNKTIGKLIAGISVAEDHGIKLPTWKRFTRPLVLTAIGFVMLLPLSTYMNMGVWALLVAADYIVMVFKHEDKVGHDYLFKTIVVQDKGTTLFNNKDEYEAYLKDNPETDENKTIYDHSDVKLTIDDEDNN